MSCTSVDRYPYYEEPSGYYTMMKMAAANSFKMLLPAQGWDSVVSIANAMDWMVQG
jgi:hypothetical protein